MTARLGDGRTIEQIFQCDIKGYDVGGTNWRLGKGKPPLDPSVDTWKEYKGLWIEWAKLNPSLMTELRGLAKTKDDTLSDVFASTPTSQARALAEILNENIHY